MFYLCQHFLIGASLSEPHTSVEHMHRPTDRVHPIHMILIRCTCPCCHAHVNSAVHSGDSYKTENTDNGKAKSRDTRATNCEAETREKDQRTSSYFHFLVGVAILGFHDFYWSLHTILFHTFLHKHNTWTPHSGRDLQHVRHTGVLSTPCCAILQQLRLAPIDHHLCSLPQLEWLRGKWNVCGSI